MSNLKRKATSTINADAKKPKANGGGISSFFSAAPRPAGLALAAAPAAAGAASVKFSKDKWVAGLTADQRELLKLEIDTLHESWLAHLKDDIISREFLELKKFLQRETAAGHKWFPPKEDVYSWSRHTPFNEVKVVIVGQDPYHNVNQAHGLAFSVRPPTPAPPSLRNMYIALKKDYPGFKELPNRGGLLTPWADRGVLMLNTCLTVRAHEANSHSNHGWEKFTQKVIDLVAQKRTRGVVFIAWGTSAGKRVVKIDKARHLVLTGVHPSPLSASRGFFDCGHFRAANEWLVTRYGDDGEIDWALVPGNTTKTAGRGVIRDGAKAAVVSVGPTMTKTTTTAAAGDKTEGGEEEEEEEEKEPEEDGEGEHETENSAAAGDRTGARAGAEAGTEAKTATVEVAKTTVKVEVAKANTTKKGPEIDEDDVNSEDEAAMYEALQLAEQMRN
ncbi:Uracil-DNA glycosylase [Escovopsis weberi]|uniref:Uracil-DNA glycosylase n=1 Tax=Escovopsis weberi TaxID=150374 RepID=A0A0M9VTT3_ESCWE|nr:Uracil-DNA glycosylase [Escovopsis weberi]